ncbi:MAG: YdgA family protein [Desulfobacterales bacterium]|nr:YdgA family protein [Desulfobacterales bacterium]
MKKSIVVLILIAAVAVAGLPYVTGMVAEKTARHLAAEFTQNQTDIGGQATIQITEYKRNWKESQVKWELTLPGLNQALDTNTLFFEERLTHGITGVDSETRLTANPWYAQWTEKLGSDPIKITTHYPLLGDIQSRINLAAFTANDGKSPLAIQPGQFTLSLDRKLTHLSYSGQWDGIDAGDKGTLKNITLEGNQTKATDVLWTGQGKFGMDSYESVTPMARTQCKDLSLAFSQDVQDQNMSIAMDLHLGDLIENDTSLAQGDVEVRLTHLDVPALETLSKTYMDIVESATDNQPMEMAVAQSMGSLISAAEGLLKKDLSLALPKIDIVVKQEKISGEITLGLEKDLTLAQLIPLQYNPFQVIDLIYLQSEFHISETLAQENPYLIHPLMDTMKTGFFVANGKMYDHKADLKQGILLLNGNEINLNEMAVK